MARAFDPFSQVDRWFSDVARTPASAAMAMDLSATVTSSSPAKPRRIAVSHSGGATQIEGSLQS